MAKKGQTTSRLGNQSVFNSVQEVGVASDGDLERGWAAFEENRSPRVVDGRKTYDKSGRERKWTGILPHTGIGIREERVHAYVHASKRLLIGDGGNLLVGLARFSCLLAITSVRVRSLQGDRTFCIKPEPWMRPARLRTSLARVKKEPVNRVDADLWREWHITIREYEVMAPFRVRGDLQQEARLQYQGRSRSGRT
jgi:hypothetical protein